MTLHDRLVRTTAAVFALRGYDVCADLKGWRRPPTARGFRADVSAKAYGKPSILAEIEHEHTLFSRHTTNQMEKLATIAKRRGALAYLVVPRDARPVANLMLRRLGLHNQIRVSLVTPWPRRFTNRMR